MSGYVRRGHIGAFSKDNLLILKFLVGTFSLSNAGFIREGFEDS